MEVTICFIRVSLLLVVQNLRLIAADCEDKCEQSAGSFSQTGLDNHAMLGHSFKDFTVAKTFDCHVKCFEEKCRCRAYQTRKNHCELLDECKRSAPDDFVFQEGYTYYEMNREYVKQNTANNACSNRPCNNQCCKQSPCANGGTCTELCDDANHKFNCTCATEYFGKFCQKHRPTSCKQQLDNNGQSQSGVYLLFDPARKSLYQVFCDFTSENGFIWTVIDSFTLANKNEFANKAFYKDYPVNQEAFTWKRYRLSRSRIKIIANHSTHVRATCNFNTDGLQYIDYLRAKLSDIDVTSLNFDGCKSYEYINIRGYDCSNCTAQFTQVDRWHAHVDSYHGSRIGCQLTSPLAGAVISPGGEDNFGFYQTINPAHRCSSSNNSTTQWWIGEQYS